MIVYKNNYFFIKRLFASLLFCFYNNFENKIKMMQKVIIESYTDGSCHTKLKVGAWAAIIFIDGKEIVLKSIELNTTNQ